MREMILTITSVLLVAASSMAQPRVEKNVVYGMYSGLALLMDVYHPEQPNGIGILQVAGSGFYAPTEFSAPALKEGPTNIRFGLGLAERGYTVFAINHRTTPRFEYPANVEDIQRAIRFIRTNATAYRIQPEMIGAIGSSSGGYGVAMAAVLDGKGNPDDADPVNKVSGKVQAVVALYAPFDLFMQVREESVGQGIPEALFLGVRIARDTPATASEFKRMMAASPITHVTSDDPPFLMLHGDSDTSVPMAQSVQMEMALKKASVEAKFIKVPGGRHGNNFQFQPDDPRRADDVGEAARWFDEYLRAKVKK